mmetsp:Transcript_29513/g.82445  ORF Transcript_29513/g.82445 Transcript_29513/m.82445 type:complete len:439 (-) Transcript_29513:2566-3882(-)
MLLAPGKSDAREQLRHVLREGKRRPQKETVLGEEDGVCHHVDAAANDVVAAERGAKGLVLPSLVFVPVVGVVPERVGLPARLLVPGVVPRAETDPHAPVRALTGQYEHLKVRQRDTDLEPQQEWVLGRHHTRAVAAARSDGLEVREHPEAVLDDHGVLAGRRHEGGRLVRALRPLQLELRPYLEARRAKISVNGPLVVRHPLVEHHRVRCPGQKVVARRLLVRRCRKRPVPSPRGSLGALLALLRVRGSLPGTADGHKVGAAALLHVRREVRRVVARIWQVLHPVEGLGQRCGGRRHGLERVHPHSITIVRARQRVCQMRLGLLGVRKRESRARGLTRHLKLDHTLSVVRSERPRAQLGPLAAVRLQERQHALQTTHVCENNVPIRILRRENHGLRDRLVDLNVRKLQQRARSPERPNQLRLLRGGPNTARAGRQRTG